MLAYDPAALGTRIRRSRRHAVIVPPVPHIDLRNPADQLILLEAMLLSKHLPHRLCDKQEALYPCF
jgi:hypothetical protein